MPIDIALPRFLLTGAISLTVAVGVLMLSHDEAAYVISSFGSVGILFVSFRIASWAIR